jgi:hypothetical protein
MSARKTKTPYPHRKHRRYFRPAYPNKTSPLVGERVPEWYKLPTPKPSGPQRARALALIGLGFPWDWWLDPELGRGWKSPLFPLESTVPAFEQWRDAMTLMVRSYMGLAGDEHAASRVGELLAGIDSDRELMNKAAPQAVNKPHDTRLTVDLARKIIILDGRKFDVSSDNALQWVKVLADHPGEWLSGSALEKLDLELANPRTDRYKRFLPDAILSLIDSVTGIGSRIRL